MIVFYNFREHAGPLVCNFQKVLGFLFCEVVQRLRVSIVEENYHYKYIGSLCVGLLVAVHVLKCFLYDFN